MKKMNVLKRGLIGFSVISALVLSSCKKEYGEFNNMQVVENTFTGDVEITSGGQDPAGDFTGNNESGTYSFAWVNPENSADVNFDVTTSGGGTVQMVINDAKGDEVLNKTRPEGDNDTFSGVSSKGRKGTWLITLIFSDLNGDGSFSISPGN